ncbi:MAG TPA: DsbA family protein [Anaerolineales bacterium]|nr:DsbA family protein [Anaerolineales bacterium]
MSPEKKPIGPASPRKGSSRKVEPVEPADEPLQELVSEEPVVKPEQTFTFKATHFYAVLVVVAFALGIIIGYLAWGRTPAAFTVSAEPPAAVEAATSAPQYVRYKIPTDGYPSLGPANAPITLVEFADFQCPFCREWEQQTYKPLLAAYPGKIRIVYRDFPLTSIHPNAMPAAEAAQCANEQGKFWDFHDKLFASENLSDDVYKQYAQELGLDMNKFNECASTHKYAKNIQADSDFATNLGINSTPTFFINGLALIGAQPLNAFTSVIDKELAGQIPK